MDPRLLHEKDEPPKAKLTSPRVPFWFAWLLWFVGLSLVVALTGITNNIYNDNFLDVPLLVGPCVGVLVGSFILALVTVRFQWRRKE